MTLLFRSLFNLKDRFCPKNEINVCNKKEVHLQCEVNIFDRDSFTLKELCNEFLKINLPDITPICMCYIKFSSNNNNYRNCLVETRYNRGYIQYDDKSIYFREILQMFDNEFNKLIIRINVSSSNYDVKVRWEDFENKINNLTKDDIKKILHISQ